ncbi:hypothetical protein PCA10_43530 [Metapseudomonas resinovorans NBRC 106553]|uniref:Uncharacterized protein n=1 Tax=Metapseudomonas resinovorans NBRC 106553 TaxID=1245471 RepID=S6AMK1_METRE|nr:hypothetical protein PCA10_43530 [Pseudomonas resinovorans NBRC 106553]
MGIAPLNPSYKLKTDAYTSLKRGSEDDAARIAPSGGRAESLQRGASGMDAARAAQGHGWPFAAAPRRKDGARGVWRSQTRMVGQALLVTSGWFGTPTTARSDSPGRAKQKPNAHSAIKITT